MSDITNPLPFVDVISMDTEEVLSAEPQTLVVSEEKDIDTVTSIITPRVPLEPSVRQSRKMAEAVYDAARLVLHCFDLTWYRFNVNVLMERKGRSPYYFDDATRTYQVIHSFNLKPPVPMQAPLGFQSLGRLNQNVYMN
jgi:hypothetical protein